MKMRSKVRGALAMAALVGAALGAGGAAAQDKAVQWRYSHWLPTTHPLHATIVEWTKSIAKESNGTINVSVFPSQQLGKATDHYDMVEKGIADIGWVSTSYEPGRMTVAAAATLPFLTTNAVEGSVAYDAWYRPHAAKDMPGIRMCLMHMHETATLHSRKEIRTPDQLAGLRVRPPGQVMGRWVTKLGATVVQVSAPESREALERGIADAVLFPYDSLYVFGLDKAVRFHTDVNMYVAAFSVIVNPASYNALSPAQKKVIDNHCNTENARLYAKQWSEREREGYRKIGADPAHTMVRLNEQEKQAWRKAAELGYQDWKEIAKQGGWDGDALLASLRAAFEKHGVLEK